MRTLPLKFLATVIATFLSGCAVMQPHVEMPADNSYDAQSVLAGGLSQQIARARVLQLRYIEAVSDQTLLTNSLAIMVIPASAAAIAVGIVNPGATATRNLLAATGAGAAATLGIGAFLIDRRRDAIYYNGAKAIYCLSVAFAPLSIENGEYEQMLRDVEELRASLAEAAAVGLPAAEIEQGNNVYAAGRRLVRETAQAGAAFSNELDKINISVNAQIASNDRNISDITAAITAIQTSTVSMIAGFTPMARTQGGRADTRRSPEARLRRSVELVTAWVKVYQSTVSATDAKLRAFQCVPANGPNMSPVQPIVIVTNGQPVTTTPGAPDASGVSPTVITVQPPPPRLRSRSSGAPISTEPRAEISTDDMPGLRAAFGLTLQNAAFPTSPKFREKVRAFQHCRGEPENGQLTPKQKTAVLSGTDACLAPPGPPTRLVPPNPVVPANPTVQPPPPGTR